MRAADFEEMNELRRHDIAVSDAKSGVLNTLGEPANRHGISAKEIYDSLLEKYNQQIIRAALIDLLGENKIRFDGREKLRLNV